MSGRMPPLFSLCKKFLDLELWLSDGWASPFYHEVCVETCCEADHVCCVGTPKRCGRLATASRTMGTVAAVTRCSQARPERIRWRTFAPGTVFDTGDQNHVCRLTASTAASSLDLKWRLEPSYGLPYIA